MNYKAPIALGRALARAKSKAKKAKLLEVYLIIYGRLPEEPEEEGNGHPRKSPRRPVRR